MNNNRLKILGVPFDTYDVGELVRRIEESLKSDHTKTIFSVNPEKIMAARRDPRLSAALVDSDFLIPDGIGTIIGAKLLYKKRIPRITGIGLMEVLLNIAEKKGSRVYIFGSKPEVNSKAILELKKNYPSLFIAGSSHGYVQEEKCDILINDINRVNSDILFVGLGSPKQEKWVHRYKRLLRVRLCMGIGGSLDVVAGDIARSPHFYQVAGLEWFYRLIKEPKRFQRQLVLPRFVFELLKEKYC
jgi:N-acetylglucosaminyldiphosphoundecaprenol N-acetyl-beta-D-mannosaminyltransferase